MALIRLNNQSLTNVTSLPAGVGGRVLQVVQGTQSTEVTHNITSYTDTNLSASITPSSTSSKIYILVNQGVFWDNSGLSIRILRDSTVILEPPSGVTYEIHDSSVGNARDKITLTHLDSPSTTSSITYKTQLHGHSGGTIRSNNDNTTSSITLMEIAG
jgi:hypothetical protein